MHRGDQFVAHGNSLPAIEHAIKRDVPLVEIDLRKSSDDVIILFHGKRAKNEGVINSSGAEISSYSSKEISHFLYEDGTRVLTFEEMLQRFSPQNSLLHFC